MAAVNSAGSMQVDYMKILVAQLQNQNPLEPMDNNEMASQLAQVSQLQQLESMSTSFEKVLATVERSYASSLIGKEVTFFEETGEGDLVEMMTGIVKKVFNPNKSVT